MVLVLLSGAGSAFNAAPLVRGWQAMVSVDSVAKLVAAVKDKTVGTIVVVAGRYNLTSGMCTFFYDSRALCIDRNLTIRAATNGTVVLDAQRKRGVFFIDEGGRAELVGLNITGGHAVCAAPPTRHKWARPSPPWRLLTRLFVCVRRW